MATRCGLAIIAAALSSALALSYATPIEGSVAYGDGKPVIGAVVYGLNNRSPLQMNNNHILSGERMSRAITDRSGRFSLNADASDTTGFFAQDMNDATGYVRAEPGAKGLAIVIERPAIGQITVFNGHTGASKENVRLVLDTDFRGMRVQYDGKTDARGMLRLPSLMPGSYFVSTWHDVPQVGCCFRSVITRAAKVSAAPGREESIKLGGTDFPKVGGRVTDTDGAPLHGVWVRLLPKEKSSTMVGGGVAWSAVSDRDGSYAIFDVPPGKYNLRAFRRLALNDATRTFETVQEISVAPDAPASESHDVRVNLNDFMPLEPGQPAPAITGKTLTGQTFSLAELRGKMVVVHFYASWCSPCVATIGEFDSIAAKLGGDSVAVVGVSLDETPKDALVFVTEKHIQHPVLYQGAWADNPIRKAYQVCNVPTSFVIGSDGRILHIDLFGEVLLRYLRDQLARGK